MHGIRSDFMARQGGRVRQTQAAEEKEGKSIQESSEVEPLALAAFHRHGHELFAFQDGVRRG
jgi:hypothetical protein